ncbi:response regulator [Paraburkholderia guartelaensis]|uniref:Response regulator n=2 Tax=Paraburkholderia guartelaensis TaxID=2546446 RepID=A0A4V2ZW49_9BURK|nr:response regulator [Paraburkholderia guartelaensis]
MAPPPAMWGRGTDDDDRARTRSSRASDCVANFRVGERRMETRILIADTDEKSLDGLSNLLTDLGYGVSVARTLDEALDLAARGAPDVAIVALSLAQDEPGAIVQHLRAVSGERVPLLIALAGWGESRHRDEALAAGFDVHLVRPVGLDQLMFILSMTGQ